MILGGTNAPFPSSESKPAQRILKPERDDPVATSPRFIVLRLMLAGISIWAGVQAFLMFQLGKSAMHETSAWVAALASVAAFVGLAVVEAIRQAAAYLKDE